ncbi:acyl-CoA dehydrogenase family protein [Lewinella cohaerens]|uniref:acyl-CoA dehydrogenase family protein n=1 Tax=Lewinella cohaerens TaxID=70995 RepID=UPI0003721B32|nr:acyl-CoA dehydrogenase family protein [Lewinella cohaerens]
MAEVATSEKTLRGGEFLVRDTRPEEIFIPEEFNEEQRMIRDMVRDFVEGHVFPNIEKLEKQEDNIAVTFLDTIAELGLLGTHMPEEYGGMALDTNTNTLICDAMGPSGAFTVSYAAHTGIGMLPILYFGTDQQKETFLPRLINGELKAAYCLTEPGSGSDALAAKTRADLTEDGKHYVLNGQKMWISNAGFADLFIVFAQIDGDKFTGFIVPRDTEGLSLGAEEAKLGIKGSSTRQVFFEDAKIPADNVLGEIGKGHLIAFNTLNVGRFKLNALCNGGAKECITRSVNYANERHQFKQPIANFGAIKYKLGEQAIRVFASESSLYRTSQLMQDWNENLKKEGVGFGEAKLQAAEEYAIECALLKVIGSEALDYVVDENLQIHGGMGYSEEGTAARAYRDSRINRIYEGTNEINRLLSVDMFFRRGMAGSFDMVGPAWAVQKELASMPSMEQPEGPYGQEVKAVSEFKKILLMVAGAAGKMQMEGKLNLKAEQEIVMNLANILIDVFQTESTLLRVQKLATMDDKPQAQEVYDAILKVLMHDATARINKEASDAVASFAEGDLLRTFLMGIKRFTKYPPVNVMKERRKVAEALITANQYAF